MPAVLSTLRQVSPYRMVEEVLVNFGVQGVGVLLNMDGLPPETDPGEQCWFQMLSGKLVDKLTMMHRGSIKPWMFVETDLYLERRVCSGCSKGQWHDALRTFGTMPRFQRCPCAAVGYCSKDCQDKHWREHRTTCAYRIKMRSSARPSRSHSALPSFDR